MHSSTHQSYRLSVYPSVLPLIHSFIHSFIHSSTHQSYRLSVYPSVLLLIHSLINSFIHYIIIYIYITIELFLTFFLQDFTIQSNIIPKKLQIFVAPNVYEEFLFITALLNIFQQIFKHPSHVSPI